MGPAKSAAADVEAAIAAIPTDQTARDIPISQESTISVLWTASDWKKHVQTMRYFRSFFNWPRSTILRKLLPLLGILAVWTRIVWSQQWKLSNAALGWMASPLSLLLAFRVNAAVARFTEARALYGRCIYNCRDLAAMLAAAPEISEATRALCCRLLVAFAWRTKAAFGLGSSASWADATLDRLLPAELAQKAAAARKPPLTCLSYVRRLTMGLSLPISTATALGDKLSDLNLCYGGMERLSTTPMSPTYMRHTSRGLMLWLLMLPCGLLSSGCTTQLQLLFIVLITGYTMLGIDEIGIQVEQPFGALPMHAMATALSKDVIDELMLDAKEGTTADSATEDATAASSQ